MEREKRMKNDIEKGKRKVEGELKVAQEAIEELNRQRHDLEQNVKKYGGNRENQCWIIMDWPKFSFRKDAEIAALTGRLEDEQNLIHKLQRQIKELQVSAVDFCAQLDSIMNEIV